MSAHVAGRLRDLFLVPDAASPARRVAERAVPTTLGVLAPPREGWVAASSLALAAAAAHRSRCAVVCRWDGAEPTPPRPALPGVAARRVAERLAGRGLLAAARGRLALVALPPDPSHARAATERTLAAIDDIPLVLLLCGPRPPALDPLLATLDRLVLVPSPDAPPGLDALALTAAAHLGRSATRLTLPDTPLGHLLTLSGRSLSPRLRAAATRALGGGEGDA
jgi:hypothetical protein